MQTTETIHTLPPGISLGNLATVKVGDEVTTLTPTANGVSVSVSHSVFTVSEVLPHSVRVKRSDGKITGSWLVRNGGGCAYAMHPQNVMRFYYSANPEHVAMAKRQAREQAKQETEKKRLREELLTFVKPLAEALGDEWQYDENDHFYRSSAANALIDNLTREQIVTLAEWMKVKLG